jgi:hypothetical protein
MRCDGWRRSQRAAASIWIFVSSVSTVESGSNGMTSTGSMRFIAGEATSELSMYARGAAETTSGPIGATPADATPIPAIVNDTSMVFIPGDGASGVPGV